MINNNVGDIAMQVYSMLRLEVMISDWPDVFPGVNSMASFALRRVSSIILIGLCLILVASSGCAFREDKPPAAPVPSGDWRLKGSLVALEDPDPEVFGLAVEQLGWLQCSEQLPNIYTRFRKFKLHPFARIKMATALQGFGKSPVNSKLAVQILGELLGDVGKEPGTAAEHDVKLASILALGEYGKEAKDLLPSLFDHIRSFSQEEQARSAAAPAAPAPPAPLQGNHTAPAKEVPENEVSPDEPLDSVSTPDAKPSAISVDHEIASAMLRIGLSSPEHYDQLVDLAMNSFAPLYFEESFPGQGGNRRSSTRPSPIRPEELTVQLRAKLIARIAVDLASADPERREIALSRLASINNLDQSILAIVGSCFLDDQSIDARELAAIVLSRSLSEAELEGSVKCTANAEIKPSFIQLLAARIQEHLKSRGQLAQPYITALGIAASKSTSALQEVNKLLNNPERPVRVLTAISLLHEEDACKCTLSDQTLSELLGTDLGLLVPMSRRYLRFHSDAGEFGGSAPPAPFAPGPPTQSSIMHNLEELRTRLNEPDQWLFAPSQFYTSELIDRACERSIKPPYDNIPQFLFLATAMDRRSVFLKKVYDDLGPAAQPNIDLERLKAVLPLFIYDDPPHAVTAFANLMKLGLDFEELPNQYTSDAKSPLAVPIRVIIEQLQKIAGPNWRAEPAWDQLYSTSLRLLSYDYINRFHGGASGARYDNFRSVVSYSVFVPDSQIVDVLSKMGPLTTRECLQILRRNNSKYEAFTRRDPRDVIDRSQFHRFAALFLSGGSSTIVQATKYLGPGQIPLSVSPSPGEGISLFSAFLDIALNCDLPSQRDEALSKLNTVISTTTWLKGQLPELQKGGAKLAALRVPAASQIADRIDHIGGQLELLESVIQTVRWICGASFLYVVLLFPLIAVYSRYEWARTATNSGVFTKAPLLHKHLLNSNWARRRIFRSYVQLAWQQIQIELPPACISQSVQRVPGLGKGAMNELSMPDSISDLFSDARFAIVLGRSGTGKTILLSRVFEKLLAEFLSMDAARLPLLIDLGSAAVANQSVQECLRSTMRRAGINLNDDVLDFLLRRGGFVVLIDSANEVTDVTKREGLVAEFVGSDALNWVLVASQVPVGEDWKPAQYSLNGVTPQQAEEFLGCDTWSQLSEAARRLTTNPQDLWVIKDLSRTLGPAQLPTGRAELYRKFIEHDQPLSEWARSADPRIRAVYALAFTMLKSRRIVRADEVEAAVREVMDGLVGCSQEMAPEVTQHVLSSRFFSDTVRTDVLGQTHKVLVFRHELMGKFLAARHLRRAIERDWNNTGRAITELARQRDWFEVFFFIVDEIASSDQLDELLLSLIAGGSDDSLKVVAYARQSRGDFVGDRVGRLYDEAKIKIDLADTPAAAP